MRLCFACLPFLGAALAGTSGVHRSQGYAGATPVGLGGYLAGSEWDCKSINADPRRSQRMVPLPDDCAVTIASPNGRMVARTVSRGENSILRVTGGLVVSGLEQPTVFAWEPGSRGFFLNGGAGSGQVSWVRYFYLARGRWIESSRLSDNANRLYLRRFDCRGGKESYTNTSGWKWAHGRLSIVVQEGVHSRGCLQPDPDRNILFEGTGYPASGRITAAHEITTLS